MLVAADGSNRQWQQDLSETYGYVGNMLLELGKPDDALEAHRNALDILERLALADRRNTRGNASAPNRTRTSESCWRHKASSMKRSRSIAMAAPSGSGSPPLTAAIRSGSATSISYRKIASILERQGLHAEALADLTKARDIVAALLEITPDHAQWKDDLAAIERQIGHLKIQVRAQ
jgi:tetratricopeptide (TPR) repeat protein